jgi:hypothetical protein
MNMQLSKLGKSAYSLYCRIGYANRIKSQNAIIAKSIHIIGRIKYIRCFFIKIAFHCPLSFIASYSSCSSSFVLKLHSILIYDMVYRIKLLSLKIKNLGLMSNYFRLEFYYPFICIQNEKLYKKYVCLLYIERTDENFE